MQLDFVIEIGVGIKVNSRDGLKATVSIKRNITLNISPKISTKTQLIRNMKS